MPEASDNKKREPLKARPRLVGDRKALRAELSKRFSKSLEYLAR